VTDVVTGPRIVSVRRRLAGTDKVYEIGRCQLGPCGWRFFPLTTAHSISRKAWPSWESCIPRWVGYPHRCETEVVR
jgi:hypothetical protein